MADFIAIERNDTVEEGDRYGNHPHPREMLWYGGDPVIERIMLDAYRSSKLHHAWLITGQEGVGKATLAYRFARFLLAHPDPAADGVQNAQDLSVSADHPVSGKVARLSHPDLSVISRTVGKDSKKLRKDISIDDVRDGLGLFRVTAGAGGWRVVIVDAADDLNRSSQNALLKMLEEPPKQAVFLLIAHRPGGLLPTIRSRCRVLRVPLLDEATVQKGLHKLSDASDDAIMIAARSAGGSLRQALALLDPSMAVIRRETGAFLKNPDQQDVRSAMTLVEKAVGKAGEAAFEVIIDMIEAHLRDGLHDAVDTAVSSAALAARAELWDKLRRSAREIETYNLDRRPFLLSVFSDLAEIERRSRA
jgi:DNA polymerase III subunit delta'